MNLKEKIEQIQAEYQKAQQLLQQHLTEAEKLRALLLRQEGALAVLSEQVEEEQKPAEAKPQDPQA